MSQRVVVITGGTGVLGSAVRTLVRARGMKCAVIDTATPVASTTEDLVLGGVDLTDHDAAQGAMHEVVSRFGAIDALLNIAGAFRWTTVAESTPADWERLFRINVQTAVNATRAALAPLKESPAGRVVNVGAGAAERAAAGMGPYAAAKAGVHRFTESLADELKSNRVTVNAVLPSIIDTPQNRADMPQADFATWVQPIDLAKVMLFLASDDARAINGALIRVSGRL
jgi:NAD(P)-dependent dehydrogenase (short-subunit alcohol dehydrogenase family)